MSILLCFLCVIASSCDEQRKAAHTPTLREHTESFITEELRRPTNFTGRRPSATFTADYYVPGLRRAAAKLGALERGEVTAIPVAAFLRPHHAGNYTLWMMWFQADTSEQIVRLHDAEGELAQFTVPSPADRTESHPHYMRLGVFRVATQPPYDGGPRKHPETSVIRTDRKIDHASVQLSVGVKEGRKANWINVAILEPLILDADGKPESAGEPATLGAGERGRDRRDPQRGD